MSKHPDVPSQGQHRPQGRGNILQQRAGSSAGVQRAAYGVAPPARTYSGSDSRGQDRWPNPDATLALLNATKMGLREQGEELSSDEEDDALPRWNVGKRSGAHLSSLCIPPSAVQSFCRSSIRKSCLNMPIVITLRSITTYVSALSNHH